MEIKRVDELTVGDKLDLENDTIANPTSDHPVWEFEYGIVTGLDRETLGCIRVDFEGQGISVGFPPEHRVIVVGNVA